MILFTTQFENLNVPESSLFQNLVIFDIDKKHVHRLFWYESKAHR